MTSLELAELNALEKEKNASYAFLRMFDIDKYPDAYSMGKALKPIIEDAMGSGYDWKKDLVKDLFAMAKDKAEKEHKRLKIKFDTA